ncbi:MAG: PDZ domain-containing protein, partial [Desulfobulbaceae bacterium]|nr:PDZ domain-containing protein [Desulfobulbaceae bacterium]
AQQIIDQGLTASRAAWIAGVRENSPAKRAGLQKGDLIVAIDNSPVIGATDLRNRISLSSPSSKVTLEYYRDKTRYTADITLGTLR